MASSMWMWTFREARRVDGIVSNSVRCGLCDGFLPKHLDSCPNAEIARLRALYDELAHAVHNQNLEVDGQTTAGTILRLQQRVVALEARDRVMWSVWVVHHDCNDAGNEHCGCLEAALRGRG